MKEAMKMSLRWYGSNYDTVPIQFIRQIPNIHGVVTTLFNKKTDEIWTLDEILNLKKEVEDNDLEIYGIESLNVSEDIKAGTPLRDEHISKYIESLTNLGKANIKMVCYNFMPLFDWTRTELNRLKQDGTYVLAYDQEVVDKTNIYDLFEKMSLEKNSTALPGWSKQDKDNLTYYFNLYKNITDEQLFDNLFYFLKAIMPICNKYDIKMAIHPDDPAWTIFDIPRIIINKTNIRKMLDEVDDVHNGLTLCTGSLATKTDNNLIDMINEFKDRIHFVHIRNIKHLSDRHFEETAHFSNMGDLDIYKIVKALYDIDYHGIVRPDHGRMIFNEKAMPGYGLYDRALAVSYLTGLYEAIIKENSDEN